MTDVYYTLDKCTSEELLASVLTNYYELGEVILCKSKNGKPFLADCPIEISIAHSADMTAVAIAQKPVGIDCELVQTKNYTSVLKRFPKTEREQIKTEEDFFDYWTAKESFIKYKGGTLARMLKQLEYKNGKMFYRKKRQNVLIVKNKVDNYILSICVESPGVNIIKLNKVAVGQE